MTIMSKSTAQDDGQNKQFKPKIYQSRKRGQTRNFYDRHDRNDQNRYRSNSGDRRFSCSGRIQYGQNYRDRPKYDHNYRNNIRIGTLRGNSRPNQNYREQNYRGGT